MTAVLVCGLFGLIVLVTAVISKSKTIMFLSNTNTFTQRITDRKPYWKNTPLFDTKLTTDLISPFFSRTLN